MLFDPYHGGGQPKRPSARPAKPQMQQGFPSKPGPGRPSMAMPGQASGIQQPSMGTQYGGGRRQQYTRGGGSPGGFTAGSSRSPSPAGQKTGAFQAYQQSPVAMGNPAVNKNELWNSHRELNTWGAQGNAYTMPGMSYGGGQAMQSNAGNAANNAFNRPAPFASQMNDGYGNPTNPQQFYGQQQDMIGNLLNRLGQQNQGTYLGPGNPPPSFFAPPTFNPQEMWGQAGGMPPIQAGALMDWRPSATPRPQYQPGPNGGALLPDGREVWF